MKPLFIVFALLITLCTSAFAHNVVSGVYADGLLIEGEIGFSNGDMAKAGVTVEMYDEAGDTLATTETEEGGIFSFKAESAQNYLFKADLGEGHIAEMALDADELDDGGSAELPTSNAVVAGQSSVSGTASNVVLAGNSISTEELQRLIRSAVAQQVRPLQKEIRAYKEKVFFRDITGGLGFIFGLFGVAAWASSRRKESTT